VTAPLAHLAALPGVLSLGRRSVVLIGDSLVRLADVPSGSVQCVTTSPPYLDGRDYGVPPTAWPEVVYKPRFDLPEVHVPAQTVCLGREATVIAYVGHLIVIFRELRRVLREDGVVWLNLGRGYSSGTTAPRKPTTTKGDHVPATWDGRCYGARVTAGLPAKQLILAPNAVVDALQAEGDARHWTVRDEIAWHKPNPVPSSVNDRCTPAWEHLYLLTKAPRYKADFSRLATPAKYARSGNTERAHGDDRDDAGNHRGTSVPWSGETAHPRNVWTIPTEGYSGEHTATFPTELARRCIVATSDPGDVVLDPFAGTGTAVATADCLDRVGLGIELNGASAEREMPERFADVAARLAVAPPPPARVGPEKGTDGPLFATRPAGARR
jgi:DNA modification methylase